VLWKLPAFGQSAGQPGKAICLIEISLQAAPGHACVRSASG
jgi:hypothetical protein